MLEMVFSAIDPDGRFLKLETQVQPSLDRLFLENLKTLFPKLIPYLFSAVVLV